MSGYKESIMNHKKTIFLTGATGLLGSYLLKCLLQRGDRVYALARSKDSIDPKDRIVSLIEFWDQDISDKTYDLTVIEGDMAQKNLGLSHNDLFALSKEVEEVFHCAAVINYSWSYEEIEKINVSGTREVFDLSMLWNERKNFEKVNYISTGYVCGDYKGIFSEVHLDVKQRFNTAYERSKYEAEKLVDIYRKSGLWIDIYRPPIILGESATGKTPVFDQHFYQVINLLDLGLFDYFPVKEHFACIVPVDELSEAIMTISSQSTDRNRNYHVFGPERLSLEKVLEMYTDFFNIEKPKIISAEDLSDFNFSPAQKMILKNLIFSINNSVILDSEKTAEILEKYGFRFSTVHEKFMLKIFEYLKNIKHSQSNNLLISNDRNKIG